MNIQVPSIDADAQHHIKKLSFSGNVRELENILERALALCDGSIITTEDLLIDSHAVHATETETQTKATFEPAAADVSLPDYLETIEKRAILKALEKTKQNKTAAAKLLGVSFRTLRYRLAKLGLSKEDDLDADDTN
jgi:two-component system, NtrC family, response regulator PilR